MGVPVICNAQTSFPDKPMRLVVPFVAGGPTDQVARSYAQKMGALLGQSMIVENKTGAGGAVGTAEVARAKPDGYTLLQGSSSTHVFVPAVMENPGYDPLRDFVPIVLFGIQPLTITVHSNVPAKNLQEFIALVKANPGKYSYASAGIGNISHIAGELFKKQAGGLEMTHVPYKGSAQLIQDFLSNRVQMQPGTLGVTLDFHRGGKLRILAVLAESRLKSAPDLPTALEQGLAGVEISNLNMFFLPRGVPSGVSDVLHRATMKVIADDDFQKALERAGVEPVVGSTPDTATKYLRETIARLTPLIKASGAKAE